MAANCMTFTGEFKREAVNLLEKSDNKSEVARNLGIHMSLLRKWQKMIDSDDERPSQEQGPPPAEELSRLKRENARLKGDNETLKKAVAVFRGRPM